MSNELTNQPVLLTGFPGFLSEYLLRQLAQHTEGHFHLLVLPDTLEQARRCVDRLGDDHSGLARRCTIHPGDITQPKLGLTPDEHDELTQKVGIVWHLAALYDLAVDESIAYRVNVGGTANILDFCEQCRDFQRLNYVSTCYVAGTRSGRVYEDELDVGQHHHNHYEATKFWAEVEVQRRWNDIPTTIVRPAIVVGHSRSGRISKYDGPYYVFQLLHRLPRWLPIPAVGRGDTPVNLVPVDFVAEAMAYLGHTPGMGQQVFQLADPHPMSATRIVDRVLELMDRSPTRGRLPRSWVERALEQSTVEAWTGVPRQALTYFSHGPQFDTSQATEVLGEAGIACPPLSTYLKRLVDFYLTHPDGPPKPHSSGQSGTDGAVASESDSAVGS